MGMYRTVDQTTVGLVWKTIHFALPIVLTCILYSAPIPPRWISGGPTSKGHGGERI